MDRTNGAGNVGRMFVAEDIATNRPPTEVTAAWLNAIQEEIAGTIEGSGAALNPASNAQLLAAIVKLAEGRIGAGNLAFFATSAAPAGYLKANGALISRATYAGLFAAIGTICGAGDGVTTFALPDLRGEFIRGFDDARGVDTGRVFGSVQNCMSQINPGVIVRSATFGVPDGTFDMSGNSTAVMANDLMAAPVGSTTIMYPETRPRNVAWLACIKY